MSRTLSRSEVQRLNTQVRRIADPPTPLLLARAALIVLDEPFVAGKRLGVDVLVDIFLPRRNAVLEVSGETRGDTTERDAWLRESGYTLKRVSSSDVRRSPVRAVATAIRRTRQEASAEPLDLGTESPWRCAHSDCLQDRTRGSQYCYWHRKTLQR